MRRFLALTSGLILTFALLMVGARAIGATNKSPAVAILDLGNCSQPCWHGIQPGKTTFEQAKALLDSHRMEFDKVNYSDGGMLTWHIVPSNWNGSASHEGNPTSLIMSINLLPPMKAQLVNGNELYSGDFRLGDAVILFGEPITFRKCTDYAYAYFANNIIVLTRPYAEIDIFDPRWVVEEIQYNPPYDEAPYYSELPRWKGFIAADVLAC